MKRATLAVRAAADAFQETIDEIAAFGYGLPDALDKARSSTDVPGMTYKDFYRKMRRSTDPDTPSDSDVIKTYSETPRDMTLALYGWMAELIHPDPEGYPPTVNWKFIITVLNNSMGEFLTSEETRQLLELLDSITSRIIPLITAGLTLLKTQPLEEFLPDAATFVQTYDQEKVNHPGLAYLLERGTDWARKHPSFAMGGSIETLAIFLLSVARAASEKRDTSDPTDDWACSDEIE
jgi:hypothetical protein